MKNACFYVLALLVFTSCNQQQVVVAKSPEKRITEGIWQVRLNLGEHILPFNFTVEQEGGYYYATITNAEEKIKSEKINFKNDSLSITLPIFNSEFRAKIITAEQIKGFWFNFDKCCDYKIPFSAVANNNFRFDEPKVVSPLFNFDGKWEVVFSPNSENEYKAIGAFKQSNEKLTGTFMTETGDYRFLEGNAYGNALYLSCFDGSHAFLFKALADPKDSTINGTFYSGTHWSEPWVAKRNSTFELSNPDSLTFLKEGYDQFSFSFPDLNGTKVTYPSEKTENKVVIVQIMGSWCPNCMDETRFLVDMYERYHDRGLEIISLCFERSPEFDQAAKNVKRHQTHLKAEWDFLITGKNGKDKAASSLPMLNHIMSFPTTIFIDRTGKIRKIHTGFYGPGTGSYYNRFYETTNAFINRLLTE